MSYDPKTATITDPTERLRRDITLLTDEQKAKIFDLAFEDLPESEKPNLAAKLPPPIEKFKDERLDKVADIEKSKNADYVATRLTLAQQAKISEKVAAMLKEAREENEEVASVKKHAPTHDTHHTKHPVGAGHR